MTKWLHGMMATQEMIVRHQALPVQGESSKLEVILEKRYSKQLLHSKGRGKLIVENPTIPGHKSITSSGLTKVGRGDALKLHLKRTAWGEGWSVETRVLANQETSKPQESKQMVRPGCSPLTS